MAYKYLWCESGSYQPSPAVHGPRESPASPLAELVVSIGVPVELLPAGWPLVCAPTRLGILVGHEELLIAGRTSGALGWLAGRQLDRWWCHVFVGDLAEQVVNAIEAGAAFVVCLNGEPGRFGDVGVGKHQIFSG